MVSPLWWTAVHLFSSGQTPSRRKMTSVCSEWQTRRTWVCSVTCLMSPQHLFTGCVSSDVSDDHLTESAATLVHTFVTSRVDQYNAILAVCYWHSAACDSNLAWRLTLARCGRSSNVQTWCHHAQTSAWQGSAVPCWLLHTGHRCCRQAASQVSHTATDGGATTSAIHCWTPSIHCAWSHGLELLAGRPPRTADWVLYTGPENLAFLQILECSAH